jgi:hypothetical protein
MKSEKENSFYGCCLTAHRHQPASRSSVKPLRGHASLQGSMVAMRCPPIRCSIVWHFLATQASYQNPLIGVFVVFAKHRSMGDGVDVADQMWLALLPAEPTKRGPTHFRRHCLHCSHSLLRIVRYTSSCCPACRETLTEDASSMRTATGSRSPHVLTSRHHDRNCKLNSRHARIIKYINVSIKSIRADNAVRTSHVCVYTGNFCVPSLRYNANPTQCIARKIKKEVAQ